MLPPGRYGRIERRDLCAWLSRGRLRASDTAEEMLARTLRAIGQAVPQSGLGALRFWGQTGERSGAWMAAADPVHLEARLDHLRLHAFREEEITRAELREMFSSLQDLVGDDDRFAFARLGPLVYLRSKTPIVTAAVSPAVIDGLEPGEFMPAGESASEHDRLLSELQMVLHEHEVNRQRASNGQRTVNSVWIWGGGTAPEPTMRELPPVFSDDPLFRGYWRSCSATGHAWTEDLDAALTVAPRGFVAVVPEDAGFSRTDIAMDRLERLRAVLKRGDLGKLTLLFRDGLSVDIERSDALRFWRRLSPLFMRSDDV